MPASRSLNFTAAVLAIALLTIVACFSAAPSECIEAAEEAGLPDEVIERLRNPGDLNAIERAALNRILSEAGIDDLCDVASDATDSSEVPDSSRSDSPTRRENGERDDSEKVEDSIEAVRQTIAAQSSARIPEDDEHRRRCRFWALNNLQPAVYEEFSKLNPDSMDDLDRILWRTKLNPEGYWGYYHDDDLDDLPIDDDVALLPRNPGIYCRDYWAEPLNRSNADLRNRGFERSCRLKLEQSITQQYRDMTEAANYREDKDNELVFQTPNQYVRILRWLDMSGDELMDSDNPPYRILQEQSEQLYAYIDSESARSIPSEADIENYERKIGTRLNLEWIGILSASSMTNKSLAFEECRYYYPQVFYGYWVPFDPDRMPDSNQEQEIDLPEYDASETPLYLPKTVTADRVRAGYPLGETAEYYHLCRNSSETENIGYYYVDHPAGDYCEKIP